MMYKVIITIGILLFLIVIGLVLTTMTRNYLKKTRNEYKKFWDDYNDKYNEEINSNNLD